MLTRRGLLLRQSTVALATSNRLPRPSSRGYLALRLSRLSSANTPVARRFRVLTAYFRRSRRCALYAPVRPLLVFTCHATRKDLRVIAPRRFRAVHNDLRTGLFSLLSWTPPRPVPVNLFPGYIPFIVLLTGPSHSSLHNTLVRSIRGRLIYGSN